MEAKKAFILSFIITVLIASNFYLFSNSEKETQTSNVKRVIDGDTLVLTSGETIRLVNINSPEKGKPGYEEAKLFLSKLENETIEMEFLGLDKYRRTLARVYSSNYINLEIIEQGFANKFLVQKGEEELFVEAEEQAVNEEKGIWKKSEDFNCLEIKKANKEKTIALKNICQKINLQNWVFKDESRKEYKFSNLELNKDETHVFEPENEAIWEDKNSLYIFDAEGKLAHHEVYGY